MNRRNKIERNRRTLYKKYSRNVYYFILSKVHSPDVAEELTQEVFFRGIKSYKKYRGESSPLTWLIGIAKNVCLEYFRKTKKEALESIKGDRVSSENLEEKYEQKSEVIELYRK
jgi:RNA polymerase sigma factor (sigma-70 family)